MSCDLRGGACLTQDLRKQLEARRQHLGQPGGEVQNRLAALERQLVQQQQQQVAASAAGQQVAEAHAEGSAEAALLRQRAEQAEERAARAEERAAQVGRDADRLWQQVQLAEAHVAAAQVLGPLAALIPELCCLAWPPFALAQGQRQCCPRNRGR